MDEIVVPTERTPAIEAWGITDPGLVRRNNEDSWFLDTALDVAVVADGMGGANCGEIASAMTVETLAEFFAAGHATVPPAQLIHDAILEANRRVFDRAQREDGCHGMGSTVVVACWQLPHILIANVGDSRAYLWRNGALHQLSYDQTLVNDLRVRFGLSEEEVSNFPHKNVLTMAVGTSAEVTIRAVEEILQPGDQVLLCSDGLSGPVSDRTIGGVLSCRCSVRERVERLITEAKAAGAPDNVTVVLLEYEGSIGRE